MFTWYCLQNNSIAIVHRLLFALSIPGSWMQAIIAISQCHNNGHASKAGFRCNRILWSHCHRNYTRMHNSISPILLFKIKPPKTLPSEFVWVPINFETMRSRACRCFLPSKALIGFNFTVIVAKNILLPRSWTSPYKEFNQCYTIFYPFHVRFHISREFSKVTSRIDNNYDLCSNRFLANCRF